MGGNIDTCESLLIQELCVGERFGDCGSAITNSLVKAELFYANFTNATFQKIPIPHLKPTKIQKFHH